MSLLEIILIAVGLAMDCFAVSIACALIMKRLQWWPMMRIALLFGLFQALMPCIGWLLGTGFYEYICRLDHWIAFGILAFLGGKMIRDDLKPGAADDERATPIDPYRLGTVLTLAVATSIDALAVGLSFSLLDIRLGPSVTVIGIASFLLSWTGMALALLFGRRLHLKANLLGGIILVCIGAKILLEHLFTEL